MQCSTVQYSTVQAVACIPPVAARAPRERILKHTVLARLLQDSMGVQGSSSAWVPPTCETVCGQVQARLPPH